MEFCSILLLILICYSILAVLFAVSLIFNTSCFYSSLRNNKQVLLKWRLELEIGISKRFVFATNHCSRSTMMNLVRLSAVLALSVCASAEMKNVTSTDIRGIWWWTWSSSTAVPSGTNTGTH